MARNNSDLFIVCGERSGDLHGSELVKELFKINPNLKIHCWGGDLLKSAGAILLEDYKSYSVMGFYEVLKRLYFLYKKIEKCKIDILKLNPKRVLLIDFPGFNLKIAKFCKRNNIKVDYYIPPKTWAWNSKRNIVLKKNINSIYSILPFEKNYFMGEGIDINYIGNPLVHRIKKNKLKKTDNYIALFPGSRETEIKYSLPILIQLVKKIKDEKFLVFGVSNISSLLYEGILKYDHVEIVYDDTYGSLDKCESAVVMSGTASLEVALTNTPHIVVFKASYTSYLIARLLVKLKYISLVNLILGKEIVKELIQDNFNINNLTNELKSLKKNQIKKMMRENFYELRRKIGDTNSSKKLADIIYKEIL